MASNRVSKESLFSPNWHHVRDVRVRLADDVTVSRQVYRKRVCWVLHRPATGTLHRLDAASFELIDRLDGVISVGELWEQALQLRDHEAPTQDAWMQLLAELHAADLLIVNSRIPVEKLFERREEKRSRDVRQRYLNPLYLRFKLIDPDAWLDRLVPLAKVIFSKGSLILWSVLMIISTLVLFSSTERLLYDISHAAQFSPYIAILFIVLYPPLKLLHELGHALAIKRCGGRVQEMGIALLIMLPLPYVDASASSLFKAKNDRMLVSAAGILVEMTVAAFGVLLWVSSQGFVSDVGLVLFLIGGISTLLVNGNPLLKFDGYYVLSDWLEIPNLQLRARRMLFEKMRMFLSGRSDQKSGHEDRNERRWLFSYGISSGIYRTLLMLSIAWMVSERWFVLGTAIAAFAIFQSVIMPMWRAAQVLYADEELSAVRPRTLALGVPLVIIALLMMLPLPHASVTRGVVWLPNEGVIRAGSDCEVSKVMTAPGSTVRIGQVLFKCVDSQLDAQEQYLIARVAELKASIAGVAQTDPVEYSKLLPGVNSAIEQLNDIRRRQDAELHRAEVDGQFDVEGTTTLLGRAFARGDIVGYTVPVSGRTVRLAFAERKIADIDEHIARVEVRIQSTRSQMGVYNTNIISRSPRASLFVPSAALSAVGGGPHPADPTGNGLQLLHSIVDFELDWPADVEPEPIGKHVDVRFVHHAKPLMGRFINSVRRAFMNRRSA